MQWFPAFPVSPQYPSEVMTLRGLLKLSEAAWRTDRRLLSGKLLCSSWGVRNKAAPTQYATKRITTRQHQTMYPASVWFATAGTDMANFLHLIIVKDVSFQTKMLLFPGYPFADFLLRVGGLHQSPIFSCCIPFQYQVLQQKKKNVTEQKWLEWDYLNFLCINTLTQVHMTTNYNKQYECMMNKQYECMNSMMKVCT